MIQAGNLPPMSAVNSGRQTHPVAIRVLGTNTPLRPRRLNVICAAVKTPCQPLGSQEVDVVKAVVVRTRATHARATTGNSDPL